MVQGLPEGHQNSAHMNILLSYSKRHFDPSLPATQQKHWGSSANILARALYEELSELGTLTYVDAQEDPASVSQDQPYDLFVGVFTHFDKWRRASRAKQSIFFAVNMHPTQRNRLLRQFKAEWHLPQAAFSSWDMAPVKAIKRSLQDTDAIIAVGNIATYNSYIVGGVPKSKVKVINYAADGPTVSVPAVKKGRRYLHVASELGLRKGFDVVAELAETAAKYPDFHLDLVGLPTNDYYKQRLNQLVERLGSQCTYHGWLDASSKEYAAVLKANDVILFPSIEEGQAGTVLDAMRYGLIPLITRNVGVDFAPLGWVDLAADRTQRSEVLQRALALTPAETTALKRKTIEYYQLMHEPWRENLRDSLRGAVAGELYPKVDVTLAIFNKEKTIRHLVNRLKVVASEYPNSEIHIIFDGCKDRTEPIVRHYFRNHPHLRVTYDVTPNIFEVKSNNLGLKQSQGKYAVILQDDNVMYDRNILYEAVTFLDKCPQAAILGGLAGVNYYPRGTKGLKGNGQIAMTPQEVYWRQDQVTDPALQQQIFEVDACMRGPLFLRKSFLEKHGYLDEIYAPLYQDDMDLAFRAKKYGFKVFCILMNVRNEMLTMAHYDAKRAKFFDDIIKRNTDIFYKRWHPTTEKNYARFNRIEIQALPHERRHDAIMRAGSRTKRLLRNPKIIMQRLTRPS